MSYALVSFFAALILGIVGHLFLKKGMNQIGKVSIIADGFVDVVLKILRNAFVWVGVVIEGTGIVLWVVTLSGMDLSFAYPVITSLNYVAIALASYILFKENITKRRWISIAVICLGVVLISFSY